MHDNPPNPPITLHDQFEGLLLGTMVGDVLGLPAEGLKPARIRRLWPGEWSHHFFFSRGMLSDDSEHALMVGQALLQNPKDASAFARSLAWKLRWWLAALPAGVGLATLRAGMKLWLGFPPHRSGVYSAGNGPAMRSALIGAFFGDDPDRLQAYVEAAIRLTHTDPKALTGALAVAHIAAYTVRKADQSTPAVDEICKILDGLAEPGDTEWPALVGQMKEGWLGEWSVNEFASRIGCTAGVSGYIYRTVPVAIYAWLKHYGDFPQTLTSVLDLGGDTDTVGAITGALAGAATGPQAIPHHWSSHILDWPRNPHLARKIAEHLSRLKEGHSSPGAVRYCWPAIPLRNLIFLTIVLAHGFRRMLPPYGE